MLKIVIEVITYYHLINEVITYYHLIKRDGLIKKDRFLKKGIKPKDLWKTLKSLRLHNEIYSCEVNALKINNTIEHDANS